MFTNENSAREYLESVRWPDGPFCPHCGATENITKLEGKSHRPGLHQCNSCREHFTVTVGTVYERSHIPLNKWLLATHLMCASKKGISAHQLHRMLGITYKSAWFMAHRIRESMKPGSGQIGGGGKVVEADETFYGNIKGRKRPGKQGGHLHKHKIFALVERDGNVRSFHVPAVTSETLKPILKKHVPAETTLYTDSAGQYRKIKSEFPKHETVNHMIGEYVRGDVHTNTVESYFGLLKRGLVGTFHHVSEAHLQRYCTEFDFRFSHRTVSDSERATALLKQIGGKRLTYRRISRAT
jgi:transposase-like protein